MSSERYELKRMLGEGTKKRVHLALDTHLDREVALACVKTQGLDEAEVARIREEARDLARLGDHPHIVTIHDILEDDGEIVLVTEYLAGGDLKSLLDRADCGRLALDETLRIGVQLARALEHAHSRGVLHRDLNPANVWLSSGGVAKLGDFGLAVSLARSRLVRDGFLVTAVAYMAPEQALGRSADARSDLYSLGAVLYELATGRPPFLGDDAVSVLSQHIQTAPVAPSWHVPGIPPALETLILRLLAKLPEERPANASAVHEVLTVISAVEAAGNGAAPRADANPLDRLAGGVFVGRDEAMAELRVGVEEAFTGSGRCFVLTGEPGIGKTRCAEEIGTYARLRNARVLVGRCVEGEGAPAYWPWVQILRELASQLGLDAARARFSVASNDLTEIVPELFAGAEHAVDTPSSDSLQLRFRLFDSVAQLLSREAAIQPLVLVLDDLHRADTPSLLLLQHLVRESSNARIVVVGTYRDVEVDSAHPLATVIAELAASCREISLAGLGTSGLARFIEISTGSAPRPSVVESIHELTGGNPLFVTEMVRLLVTEGRLDRPLDVRSDRISRAPGIRHTIGKRLERLSPSAREMLKHASVIGREFGLALLETICPEPPSYSLLADLDEALASRMLETVGEDKTRFRFSHVLIRDALYEGLPISQRLQLHRSVGEAIEALNAARLEPHLAELAYHFFEAVPAAAEVGRKAVAYAVRAGDLERTQLAYEDAAAHYALALRALDRTPDPLDRRAEILCSQGEMYWAAGNTPRARTVFLEAADVARKLRAPALLARAAFGHAGRTDASLDVDHASVTLMEEALGRMPQEDDPLRASLMARLATGLYFSSDHQKPERLAREALEMAERLNDPSTLAYALSALHYVLWGPGNARERLELADRQLAVGQRSGARDIAALGQFARFIDLLELGEVAEADAALAAHATAAAELRQPFFVWQSGALRSLRSLLAGDLEEAERLMHEALAHGQQARSPNAVTMFGGQLYFLRREQGRIAELTEAIQAMVEENPNRPLFRFALAHLYAESGRDAAARALFDQLAARDFSDLPRDMSFLDSLWLATQVCAHFRDEARAARIHELLLPYESSCIVVSFGVAWCGAVSHALGILASVLGNFDDAERHFEQALRVHQRAGARPLLAHTQREFGATLLARGNAGDEQRAAELLADARETYRELGMASHLERTEALLVQQPEPANEQTGGFRFEDGEWVLGFADKTVHARDVRGLHYLARLIETPNQEVHVSDLVANAERAAAQPTPAPDENLHVIRAQRGSELLDETTRSQYRQRVEELREELGQAEARNDLGRIERARAELEMVEAELAAAFGLAGRSRRSGDDVERARKAVSNRIRDAIRRVERLHPRLGKHLDASVRTGTWCAYRPELPVRWQR